MANRPNRASFAERRKYALKDFREQAVESQSQLASIFLTMDDGSEVEIPHPMLIADDAQARLEIVQSGQDFDKDEDGKFKEPPTIDGKFPEPFSTRLARALLGEAEHKRFVEAGGHSNDITLAWQLVVNEHKETAESDPK